MWARAHSLIILLERREQQQPVLQEQQEIPLKLKRSMKKQVNIILFVILHWGVIAVSVLWIFGYVVARLSNAQKDKFKRDPNAPFLGIKPKYIETEQGRKVLVNGFWSLSRHPNYFETDRIEQMSLQDTYRTIKYANECCLVVDPTHNLGGSSFGLTQQDLDIARMVEKEGRALVIACNKWDLVKQPYVVAQQIESQIESSLAQVQGISVVVCSAKTGKNLSLLLKECEKAYQKWSAKIPTNNAFIRQYLETKPVHASYPKIRYLSQVAVRPPTFCIHTQNKKFPTNFERQIVNAINLGGVPFRVIQKLGNRKDNNKKEDQ